MSVSVNVNNSVYVIPQTNETGWGDAVTSWIQAISSATLQKNGGTFTLTAEIDFGATYGLKSAYYKSRGTNLSSTGIFRLANTEGIGWRNAANDADLLLKANASNRLEYDSEVIPTLTSTDTLENKTLTSPVMSSPDVTDALILSEVVTPATPSSGKGKVYFKSDGFLYQLNDDGTETKVGAGSGGINYISNPDFESTTTGWAVYADAAATTPVDGTGGSANITLTRSTSSPLRGTANGLITKDAA